MVGKIVSRTGFVALVGLLVFSPAVVGWLVDYNFFSEVGLLDLWYVPILWKLGLFVVGAAMGGLVIWVNVWLSSRSKVAWVASVPKMYDRQGQPVAVSQEYMKNLGLLAAGVMAVISGLVFAGVWRDVLLYLNQVGFGVVDAQFGMDVGFYVFSLPVFRIVLGYLTVLWVIGLGVAVFVYFIRGLIAPFSGWSNVMKTFGDLKKYVRLHLSIGGAVLFGLLAASLVLDVFELLVAENSLISGARWVDVNVNLPIMYLKILVYAVLVLAFLSWSLADTFYVIWYGFVALLLIYPLQGLAPSIAQRFWVDPNELVKETEYLDRHIEATRLAYAVDDIAEERLTGDIELSSQDIEANEATVKNIRLWDRAPLLSTFSQIQEIRTYYEFQSVTNDRYMVDGELRQLMLSLRELDAGSLPTQNWINKHLTFTHGYGLAAGPVNQVTPEGLPVLFVKDLPPTTEVEELEVSRPELYYGGLSNEYVIVNTDSLEFDYPKGDEQVYGSYEGDGGVVLDSWWKRILYAVHFGSINILLNTDIRSDSRIMYYRQVRERVDRLLPFFSWDQDPYSVLVDGRIYWVMDGFTQSNFYPYAKKAFFRGGQANYVRNAVKVVVDAYDGAVRVYVADENDPIMQAIGRAFPGVFLGWDEMGEGLKAHMRYPEDLFRLQSGIYSTYHMVDEQIFYNREDEWEIPVIAPEAAVDMNTDGRMTPRHIIMKLPDEESEEFILMQPFTPRAKDNLRAWMVARNDGEFYGQLKVYTFPKDTLVFGPRQVISRINQDAEVSRQITLWDQRGSQVIQGPLLVIPIEKSLIYVRPLYLQASDGKIPELKRVIVAYGSQISMAETLDIALGRIFGAEINTDESVGGEEALPVVGEEEVQVGEVQRGNLERAGQLYEEAMAAQQRGDWAEYGRLIDELGRVLRGE